MRSLSTTVRTLSIAHPDISEFLLHARDRVSRHSLARFADPRGFEAGTLRGSQWSPSVFLGDRERGLFGGASFFFDFQKRPGQGRQFADQLDNDPRT